MSTDKPTVLSVVDGSKKELPEELKKQLSRSYIKGAEPSDAITNKLIALIDKTMTIDEIIVAYWEQTDTVLKRATTSTKLHTMSKKGLISVAPNSKGTYQPIVVEKTVSSLPAIED